MLKRAKKAIQKDSSLSAKQAKELVSEPLIAKFNPLRHFGAISEKMSDSMRSFMKEDSLSKKVINEGRSAP